MRGLRYDRINLFCVGGRWLTLLKLVIYHDYYLTPYLTLPGQSPSTSSTKHAGVVQRHRICRPPQTDPPHGPKVTPSTTSPTTSSTETDLLVVPAPQRDAARHVLTAERGKAALSALLQVPRQKHDRKYFGGKRRALLAAT